MTQPSRIHSVPIGFGADGPTWADDMTFPNIDEIERGPRSPYPYPWAVVVEWTIENGKAVPTRMELRAMHGQPVTATAWRSVPVAQVIERARNDTQGLHDVLGTFLQDHHVPGDEGREHERLAGELAPAPQRRRGRPFAMSDDAYRRVAEVYNDAVDAGDPKPVKAVRKRAFHITGDPKDSTTDPHDFRPKAWVREARRRGLIPRATVGGPAQADPSTDSSESHSRVEGTK